MKMFGLVIALTIPLLGFAKDPDSRTKLTALSVLCPSHLIAEGGCHLESVQRGENHEVATLQIKDERFLPNAFSIFHVAPIAMADETGQTMAALESSY